MVVALTDEMKDFLLKNRLQLSENRICTIANWAHETKISVTSEAYKRFGYQNGQFIVSYFGNMGICQDMNTLLGAIQLTKDNPAIQYLIVGHGSKMGLVRDAVHNLPHVQVLDFLVGKDFEQAVSISSVSVVSLEKGLKGTCAPSKYYSYLQGGKAVIAIVENDSYLADEVSKENVGIYVEIGDSKRLADVLISLQQNPAQVDAMGQNAEKIYNEKYRLEVGLSRYYKMIKQLL